MTQAPARVPVALHAPTASHPGAEPFPGEDASAVRLRRETAKLLSSRLDRINFGCGEMPLAGWTNIDNGDGVWYAPPAAAGVIHLDIFEAIGALPEGRASCIFSEHLFEHFTLAQGRRILRGWLRALRPGGVVRIVTPDLEAEAEIYLGRRSPAPRETYLAHKHRWLGARHQSLPGEEIADGALLNYGMRLDGHRFIYDEKTLGQELHLAGFETITRVQYGRSAHEALRGIERHDGGETGRTFVPALSLVMEATKPASPNPSTLDAQRATIVPCEALEPQALGSIERRLRHDLDALHLDLAALRNEAGALRRRLFEAVIERCREAGHRRIALYGAGEHTRRILAEQWCSPASGATITCIIDDRPKFPELSGVPVLTPEQVTPGFVDAVVLSSDVHEGAMLERARAVLGAPPRNLPVMPVYAGALASLRR